MNGVLVLCGVGASGLDPASLGFAALARGIARELGGGPAVGALLGSDLSAAKAAWARCGLDRIVVVEDVRLASYTSEAFIAAAEAIIAAVRPSLVVVPHSIDAAEWVPRLAAERSAALVTACSAIVVEGGRLMAVKPVCGGALEATYGLHGDLAVITFAGAVPEIPPDHPPSEIAAVALPVFVPRIEVLADMPAEAGSGPDLRNAKIVVAGGLGLGDAKGWELVERAATELGAAVGASRAAVEMGWAPPSRQVGFSGLKVGPDLYVAIGISGAQHHMAGLARAGTLVAINSDPDAPIFRHARFGVVGDARLVVPALVERLRQRREKG